MFEELLSLNESTITTDYCADAQIDESVELSTEGAMKIIYENIVNWNSINNAIDVEELRQYYTEGTEIITEAGKIAGIFDAIKKFFVSIFEKVSSMIKQFIKYISDKIDSDAAFLKKYREPLKKLPSGIKVEIEGYEGVTKAAIISPAGNIAGALDKLSSKVKLENITVDKAKSGDLKTDYESLKDGKDDMLKEYKKAVSGIEPTDNFKKALKKEYIGEKKEKEVESGHVSYFIKIIDDTRAAKEDANKILKNFKDVINKIIANLKKTEKTINKLADNENASGGTALEYVRVASGIYKEAMNANTLVISAYLTAVSTRNKEAKVACKAILKKAGRLSKGEATNESYEQSFLGDIRLI